MNPVSGFWRSVERLVAALTDPARRDRTVIGVLITYVLVWTLYAMIAKASQGVHFDMAESFALWHEPGFGSEKHPPFAAVVSGLWFSVFPVADWSFYLLSMSVVGAATLDSTFTNNLQQLAQLVPSLNYVSPNPRNTAFTIRGLGSSVVAVSQANDGLEPGVGFYVDGVYHARPATAAFDFVDLDRVEVLERATGKILSSFGSMGHYAGQFDQPHGSSDGGAVLLKACDERPRLTERIASDRLAPSSRTV